MSTANTSAPTTSASIWEYSERHAGPSAALTRKSRSEGAAPPVTPPAAPPVAPEAEVAGEAADGIRAAGRERKPSPPAAGTAAPLAEVAATRFRSADPDGAAEVSIAPPVLAVEGAAAVTWSRAAAVAPPTTTPALTGGGSRVGECGGAAGLEAEDATPPLEATDGVPDEATAASAAAASAAAASAAGGEAAGEAATPPVAAFAFAFFLFDVLAAAPPPSAAEPRALRAAPLPAQGCGRVDAPMGASAALSSILSRSSLPPSAVFCPPPGAPPGGAPALALARMAPVGFPCADPSM